MEVIFHQSPYQAVRLYCTMFNQGPFVGVRPYYSPLADEIVLGYIARVTADGGYYEGIVCLEDKLNQLRIP
jgi:hypothetical protein